MLKHSPKAPTEKHYTISANNKICCLLVAFGEQQIRLKVVIVYDKRVTAHAMPFGSIWNSPLNKHSSGNLVLT